MTDARTLAAATEVLRCYSGVAAARVVADPSAVDFPEPMPLSGVPPIATLSIVDGRPRLHFPGVTLPAEVTRCLAEDLDVLLASPDAVLTVPATERLGGPPPVPEGDVAHSVPELFWHQVAVNPDRTAVLTDGVAVSYRELGDRVASCAHLLADVHSGQRVGLLLDHGVETITAILATLTVGAVYVPLDPRYPVPRLAAMSTQAGIAAVLTTSPHGGLATELAPGVPQLDIAAAQSGVDRPDRPLPIPADPAYVLHTSGSTGVPKGVVQRHRNTLHQIRLHRTNFAITPADRVSVVSSFAFDMAVTDTFAALLSGACCVPVDVRAVGLAGLATALRRDRVTILHATPTVFRYLFDSLDGPLPDLRVVLLGGEAVTVADLARCRGRIAENGMLVNGYGATEISFAAQNPIPMSDMDTPTVIPIGRPLHGIRVALLTDDGRPAALAGEIAISSEFLADYWNPTPEAAARFDVDHTGVRRYRTGDLARRRPDGTLEYLGRRDRQVKIRGHRVEPGEVEVALGALPGVERCAVVPDSRGAEQLLRAFVVTDLAPPVIRAHLASVLPDHLVPETIERVPDLPLTPTGKVDGTALVTRHPLPARVDPATPPPGTEVIDTITGIWADVLGRADIGTEDRFFDLGGHSLLAATVHRRLLTALDRDFPLTTLYEHPTIAGLAAHLTTPPTGPPTTTIADRMARRQANRTRRG